MHTTINSLQNYSPNMGEEAWRDVSVPMSLPHMAMVADAGGSLVVVEVAVEMFF
jgi:hypothetical protein